MMNKSSEILALINLIDDPDEEIFNSVANKFVDLGEEIIPILQEQLDFTSDLSIIYKIEDILYKISFTILSNRLTKWHASTNSTLLEGSIIISNFISTESDIEDIYFEVEKIKKSIWLEMNDYLTPLEEINVINKILFSYYNFKGLETSYHDQTNFDFKKLLISKKSTSLPFGALYLIISELLKVPLRAIDIPKQNLIGYYSQENYINELKEEIILFFIDPLSGHIYTHNDIDNYLKKINYHAGSNTLIPLYKEGYIGKWIREISKCYKEKGEISKANDLIRLADSIHEI